MKRHSYRAIATLVVAVLLPGCSAKIHGMVQLVDRDSQSTAEGLDGTVVNLINTTTAVEQASHSVTTDGQGRFESVKDRIRPGMYKVEVSRLGYET
jgi:hypothetical protein